MSDVPALPALEGWSIVVTRPTHQADGFVAALTAHGASVLKVPTIAIEPPTDGGRRLHEKAAKVAEFDWVVFTSENAVDRLFDAIEAVDDLKGVRIAVIGDGTAEALLRRGFTADLVPARYVAEALVDAFPPAGEGRKVLLPRAAVAREVVPEGLRRLGWEVDVVEAYKTVSLPILPTAIDGVRSADAITFTSSSTVRGFLASATVADLPPVVASIGPITSATATKAGIDVSLEAEMHTAGGLATALAAFARTNGRRDRRSRRS